MNLIESKNARSLAAILTYVMMVAMVWSYQTSQNRGLLEMPSVETGVYVFGAVSILAVFFGRFSWAPVALVASAACVMDWRMAFPAIVLLTLSAYELLSAWKDRETMATNSEAIRSQVTRLSNLETEIGEKEDRVGELNTEIGEKEGRVGELDTEIEDKVRRSGELDTEIEEKVRRSGELDTEIEEKVRHSGELDTEIGRKEQKLAEPPPVAAPAPVEKGQPHVSPEPPIQPAAPEVVRRDRGVVILGGGARVGTFRPPTPPPPPVAETPVEPATFPASKPTPDPVPVEAGDDLQFFTLPE